MESKKVKLKKKASTKENVSFESHKQFAEKVEEKLLTEPIQQIEEMSKKASQKLDKAASTFGIYEINRQLADIQGKLFAENMNFCNKVISCYSIQDITSLCSNYFSNIVDYCFVESNKLNNLLLDANNKFIQKTLNGIDS